MQRGFAWSMAVVACAIAAAPHAGCKSSDPAGSGPDTDGDGLSDVEELNVYHTSPLIPDTDGDGLDDYKEVVTLGFDPNDDPFRYNPRVADVPLMTVVIANQPIVTVEYTLSNGVTGTIGYSASRSDTWSETYGPTWGQSRSDTQSVSQTNTNDNSVTNTNEVTNANTTGNSVSNTTGTSVTSGSGSGGGSSPPSDAGADGAPPADAGAADGADAGPADAGAGDASAGDGGGISAVTNSTSTTVTNDNSNTTANRQATDVTTGNSVSTTVNPSTTFTASYSYTDQMTRQLTDTLTHDVSYAESHGITLTGGGVRVTTVIENRSHLGIRVTNLVLTLALRDANGTLLGIRGLNLDMGDFTTWQPFALGPGEKSGITVFRTGTMTLEAVMRLLQNLRSMDIELGVYELDDPTGKAYAFDSDAIGSRTALVAIEYGTMRDPELYQVATDFVPGRPSVDVGTVFHEILRVPYTAATDTGLTGVRSVVVRSSGPVHWTVDRLHDTGPDLEDARYGQAGKPYDFNAIQLRAGDVLHVALAGAGNGPSVPDGTQPLAPEGAGVVAGDGGISAISDGPDGGASVLDSWDGGSMPVLPGAPADGGFPVAPP